YLQETPLFATAIYSVIDPVAGMMRTACAGHLTPLLLRDGHPVSVVTCEATVPLFMFDLPHVPVSTYQLRRGDRLVFYTDGLTERQTAAGDMFGFERLVNVLGRDAAGSPQHLLRDVIAAVEAFANGREPDDDQTILVVSIL